MPVSSPGDRIRGKAHTPPVATKQRAYLLQWTEERIVEPDPDLFALNFNHPINPFVESFWELVSVEAALHPEGSPLEAQDEVGLHNVLPLIFMSISPV